MALITDDPCQHWYLPGLRRGAIHQYQRRRTVRDGARIGRRNGALLAKCRLQGRDLLRSALAGLLVFSQQQAITAIDACQLGHKRTRVLRIAGPLQRRKGKLIHGTAGQTGLIGTALGMYPHQLAIIGILQTVEE